MSSGSSHDTRSYRREEDWNGGTRRTYDDGTVEERRSGWGGVTRYTDSNGNSGVERRSGGYIYRKDQDGNTSWRQD